MNDSINLENFLFKNVIMTDINGNIHKGYVGLYETPYENESNEDSIGILINPQAEIGIEFYQSEIKSIVIDEEREKNR